MDAPGLSRGQGVQRILVVDVNVTLQMADEKPTDIANVRADRGDRIHTSGNQGSELPPGLPRIL